MAATDAGALTLHELEPIERETIKRVTWRLIPLLMLGYFCAYLDRSNVGMAGTTMVHYLGFSNTVFGFGAGLFFLGYFIAEIPSNLILNNVGARRWIARILLTWGIIAALTGFVWNEWSFYGNRVLLGLAEAGFYPGVLLYMTWWFPSYYRTRMMGIFQSASVISLFVGPPIGGLLLQLQGFLGLQGWQWLFIIEGLPPIIMCFVTWQLLTDRPKDAAWLRPEQRTWLQQRLDSEQAQREAIRKYSLGQAFANPKLWLLTLAYVGQNGSGYGLVFFLPLIVKGLGVSTDWIGLVSALPYLCAFVAMIYWGYHSDLHGERTWHVAGRGSRRRGRAGGLRPHRHRPSGHHDDRALRRDDGSAILGADLLVAAQRHADRRCSGGWPGHDQRRRQSGWLARAVGLWVDQGCDGQRRHRAAVPGGGAADHCDRGGGGRPRSAAGTHDVAFDRRAFLPLESGQVTTLVKRWISGACPPKFHAQRHDEGQRSGSMRSVYLSRSTRTWAAKSRPRRRAYWLRRDERTNGEGLPARMTRTRVASTCRPLSQYGRGLHSHYSPGGDGRCSGGV